MKRIIVLVAFLLVGAGGSVLAQGGSFDLSWYSLDSGGATFLEGNGYTLGATIGQADAGSMSGGPFSVTGGFWSALNAIGVSALSPSEGSSVVGAPTTFTLTWTHPVRWRDLEVLELIVRDEQGVAMRARFTEGTEGPGVDGSIFSLLDEASQVIGTARPGSNGVLESEFMTLHMGSSVFRADGPDDPTVAVDFTVSFKAPAAGRTYALELIASDDAGNAQGPEQAGIWLVDEAPDGGYQLFLPVLGQDALLNSVTSSP